MDRYRRTINPFEAMAEPARRRIIEVLASGEHTAGQLAEAVGGEFAISRTAVSKHLRILRDAGFLDVRAEYQWRWYFLTRDGLERLEYAVEQLRQKMAGGLGWDTDLRDKRDPLGGPAFDGRPVLRKGPGREPARGRRGHQTSAPRASDPEAGLYPVLPVVGPMPPT
ncbi:metalloregulator ArsR/SmtB family transcription factor [Microbacterium sp. zg.Y625]|uniref:ArsR/SmtB family transcription factor n=1 Tax=Microbacterium jiangjiandongii TaxID=3049071 RepID=UPI00214B7C75|nr:MULTISPECIES: metalloregulator ArsR/SmtB family transcription factor [unclassified Microbacterium]MCR2791549.1 metalloregulator ArsR/SmtB family transcription factor [Microbacterium sp. zg.Y625]MCR2816999.1 metalloregulator ArsR/SmtB family transcription factor [Microbacterium sp. zg.Y843]WIM24377.1 metalloregulator ArsR/SmtB family transcription factor [Microbacterium sp. zg-Y625]